MSQITENTIIINTSDEDAFLEDVEKFKSEYRLDGVNKVFGNNEYTIYVYDCNGDGPWEVGEDVSLEDIPAIETNYGYGDEPWTRIDGDDVDEPLKNHLKEFFPKDYKSIRNQIGYTF